MIFKILPEDIEALSDTDLRTLVGYLAEQEVIRAGYSPVGVTYGGHQNSKDGGIDVRVDLGDTGISGFIPRGRTGFQVKAEDMPKAEIEDEMSPQGVIKKSIVELGKNGGSYVIVSSKGSVADTALSKRKNAMSAVANKSPETAGLHVDFYDRTRIATWVNTHPGLIVWVKYIIGKPLTAWRPFNDWSSSPGGLEEDYIVDEHVRFIGDNTDDSKGISATEGINKLRTILAQPKGVVRLVGLSGVGKTRLAQALFDEKIGSNALDKNQVVYTDLADGPDPIPMEMLSHLQTLGKQSLLIVDNCGVELHSKLVAALKQVSSKVSILTIEYDISDDQPESTNVYKLEPSSADTLSKIIARKFPHLSEVEIRTITSFSEGNSRIALALANTAQHGDSLANLKDSALIKRLFLQNHKEDPDLLRAAQISSLVYSFDGETISGVDAELPLLADLAGQTTTRMHEHIAELGRRQLVQKRGVWRALLPHALAHKLAKEALENIPSDDLVKKFVNVAPERLLLSFSRRLGYLHDLPEAQKIVDAWMAKGGRLFDIKSLSKLDITILDNIAPVNPAAVLKAIKLAADADVNFCTDKNEHRDDLVSLLRSIAYEPDYFDDAIDLIKRFSYDKESYNNMGDASQVFKSLFYAMLSGTLAPAKQRAAYIMKLAVAGKEEDMKLILSAVDAMLECSHFSSGYGFEFGSRKRTHGLRFSNRVEQDEWFKTVLNLVLELSKLEKFNEPMRKLFASQLRFLVPRIGLIDDLIAIGEEFSKNGGWTVGWAQVRWAARVAKKNKNTATLEKLNKLAETIKPRTLQERISAYVLPEQWTALDIAEIDFDNEKRYEQTQKQIKSICEEIGTELASDIELFRQEIPRIAASNSQRAWEVIRAIGAKCKNAREFWKILILEDAKGSDGKVFSGAAQFLEGISKQDRAMADELLDEALEEPSLHKQFVQMQINAGVDSQSLKRLLKATKIKTVPIENYWHLAHGRALDKLTPAEFKELVLAILAVDGGLDSAFNIVRMRYFGMRSDNLPVPEAEKDAGRILLQKIEFNKGQKRDAIELATIMRIALDTSKDVAVAEQLARNLYLAIGTYKVNPSDYGEVISILAQKFPRVVLDTFVDNEFQDNDIKRDALSGYRQRGECPLKKIDTNTLLEWANENPDTRFIRLSEVMRPWEQSDGTHADEDSSYESPSQLRWTKSALRLIEEAPEPLAVFKQFVQAIRPSGWSGSLADILERKKPLLVKMFSHSNPIIAEAAKKAFADLEETIIRVRDDEIARSRKGDERFEW